MGERLQQCLETPVGQSIASEPGCLRWSLPPTALSGMVHAASLHTTLCAAKISPPGTRWNSKQNKLFLTWLYWAFPSSYIKKKERRQRTGGTLEANCRGSGVHIGHCVESRRCSNAGAFPPEPCLPNGELSHLPCICGGLVAPHALHAKPLIKSKRSVTVWLTRPCSSMWPPLALRGPPCPLTQAVRPLHGRM